MACIEPASQFKGVSIGVLDANIIIQVQDIYGVSLENASVTINCLGNIQTGETDEFGCFMGLVPPTVDCDITITKECYHNYEHKFTTLSEAQLSDAVNNNFVIKAVDASDVAIDSASVTYEYLDSNDVVVDTQAGATNSSGIFEGEFRPGFKNKVTITNGPDSYTSEIDSFVKVQCEETGFRMIPVLKVD